MKNRRAFIKQASCLTGVCLCGFSSIINGASTPANSSEEKLNSLDELKYEWISTLLLSIDGNTNKDTCRTIMKACAVRHYESLKMDDFLSPYISELEKFNLLLEKEWGWKVSYKKDEGIIIADENKNVCVCPMVNKNKGVKSAILCYCSEGFAELMFSKVVGHPVKAEVVSSIHRGSASCVYKISLT